MALFDDELGNAGRPTDAPRVGPTIVPAFDVEEFARDSGVKSFPSVLSDTVLEVVSDVSWSAAQLDLVEREVIEHLDGVSPVSLIESVLAMPREELHATLMTLLARGILAVATPAASHHPESGTVRRAPAVGDGDVAALELALEEMLRTA
jgi:hypothetical protein